MGRASGAVWFAIILPRQHALEMPETCSRAPTSGQRLSQTVAPGTYQDIYNPHTSSLRPMRWQAVFCPGSGDGNADGVAGAFAGSVAGVVAVPAAGMFVGAAEAAAEDAALSGCAGATDRMVSAGPTPESGYARGRRQVLTNALIIITIYDRFTKRPAAGIMMACLPYRQPANRANRQFLPTPIGLLPQEAYYEPNPA